MRGCFLRMIYNAFIFLWLYLSDFTVHLIHHSHYPQRKLLPRSKFYIIGKNKGIRQIGYLLKSLIRSTHLENIFMVDYKVPLRLSILHLMVYGQLIHRKRLPYRTNLHRCRSYSIKQVRILEIYFIRFCIFLTEVKSEYNSISNSALFKFCR